MKSKNVHYPAVSTLIVTVLAITAFARGNWKLWLLIAAFIIWGIGMLVNLLLKKLYSINFAAIRSRVRHIMKKKKRQAAQSPVISCVNDFNPVDQLLLQHVSYRILDYLHKLYPDAKWEWTTENVVTMIRSGGTARIRLFDVPEYNFAEITFNPSGEMTCEFLNVVSFSQVEGTEDETEESSIDPAVWYELQGRRILENLIVELKSHGHKSLTIQENGDICIGDGSNEAVQDTFKNFPPKSCWPGIAKVMQNNGLVASIDKARIQVTW